MTWSLRGAECEDVVYTAVKYGYRNFDTARSYANQREVGRSLRRAFADGLCSRDDLFVTSKVYSSGDNKAVIGESNDALGLDYIDLMLIHQHCSGEQQLWRDLEWAVSQGIVRSVGLSNFYTPGEYDIMIRDATILPAVIQNENHIFYQNTALRDYVSKDDCIIESWYPFGGRGNTSKSLNNSVVLSIASKYGKSAAQVILRWHLQAGFVVLPSSGNVTHVSENIQVFDFELTEADMNAIAAINANVRYENW